MHQIEPYYSWLKFYDSSTDELSPFHGKEYNYELYTDTIYGYYIDPAWDAIGSETLYIKILYADYDNGYAVIEMIGEWNDALHNDIMHFKRNIIEHMILQGLHKFILIGENILNFHGSDDCYYEEWFEELEDGWIVAVNFREFVTDEWKNFNVDYYINFGGQFDHMNWRTQKPGDFCERIESAVTKRLGL
ncbi:hypothetical protein GCM10011506_22480 [Marivirga lumbricoides]|uniref:Uncharacterized protein n=1 Tax=Marivirga lumbricoides TaxID=1046115 RepID=A0ABQ1M9A5_9BACT|nr:hypothetical protein GCM10011506_22480 [Marivirga lumbricoides]